MRHSVTLFFPVVIMLGLGCTDEGAPPAEPEPRWTTVELGEVSRADGEVLLVLRTLVVSDGVTETLSVEATVKKVGSALIEYDTGGCGCDNPSVRIETEDGEACRTVRRMCPCWSDYHELGEEEEVHWIELYPLEQCVAGVGEAIAHFSYSVSEAGEWVHHSIEVRLEVVIPPAA